MGLLDKLTCKAGLHKGEWVLKSEGQCVFQRKCENCGEVKENVEHQMAPPQPTGQGCRHVARCNRCSYEEYSEEHRYGPWTYESPTSCRQIRFCLNCNASNLGDVIHKYEVIARDEEAGAATQRCEQCGHEKTVNES